MSNKNKYFYQHLHAFRGFSIINIVAAHTWVMLLMILSQGQVPDELKSILVVSETLFHNATIYFAMISGILYSLVLSKHSWKKFYLAKVRNVLSPYIIFSILLAFLGAMILVPPGSDIPSALAVIKTIPLHILKGTSFGHMWYIPVLIVLFILTPLLSALVNNKKLWPVLIVLLLCPLFFSRTWPDTTWQNFIFFVGPYSLGLFIGAHYELVLERITQYQKLIIAGIVIISPVLFTLYAMEYDAIAGIKLQESVGYLHKIMIGILVLSLMKQSESKLPKFLNKLGDYSFSIYFVHMVFIIIFAVILVNLGLAKASIMSVILWGGPLLIVSLLTSIAFSKVIKLLTGKYSRAFIGS